MSKTIQSVTVVLSNYAGFVYQWTNLCNGKKYIGSHKGPETDGYIGSGLVFKSAVKKYGIQNFKRDILEYAFSVADITILEQKYLDLYQCAISKEFYNISLTATGGNMGQDYKMIGKRNALINRQNGHFDRTAIRMKANNPNAGGVARLAYIQAHGVPVHTQYRLSDKGADKLSSMMKTNNPMSKVRPWTHPAATPDSLMVWKDADLYYDWWNIRTAASYCKMATAFGYKKYTMSHHNMIKRFRTGWIPREDTDWLSFRRCI